MFIDIEPIVNEAKDIGDVVVDRETEQGFTPGPWEVRGASEIFAPDARANIATVSDPYASRVVGYTKLRIDSDHFDEACSNALLIAAAPALYEAARFAASVLKVYPMEMSERMAIEKLDAALALVDSPATPKE